MTPVEAVLLLDHRFESISSHMPGQPDGRAEFCGPIDPGRRSAVVGNLQALSGHKPPRWFGLLARRALRRAPGRDGAARVVRIADERYEPPPVPGAHSRGAPDIQLASYLLALRDALIETRKPPEEALDVLTATVHPRDPFSRTRFRENLARRLFYRPPDWVMTDVEVPGCYAFDVHHCVYADYLVGRAEAELCQRVLCDQDRRMAQRRGQPLLRAGTLAGGADRATSATSSAPAPTTKL